MASWTTGASETHTPSVFHTHIHHLLLLQTLLSLFSLSFPQFQPYEASLLILEHDRHVSTSGPLHMLFTWPVRLFLQTVPWLSPSLLSNFTKMSPFLTTSFKILHISNQSPQFPTFHFSFCIPSRYLSPTYYKIYLYCLFFSPFVMCSMRTKVLSILFSTASLAPRLT